MLSTLGTLGTPFPKNFFQKLFRVENTIGANTLEHFLLYGMGSDGQDINAIHFDVVRPETIQRHLA
jgi:hypothetical protein